MSIDLADLQKPCQRWPGVAATVAVALSLCASRASAQPAEPLTQHTEAAPKDEFQEDVTTLNASLGGSLNTGNTEAWQLNTGSAFALVRGRHGVAATVDFSYGRANVPDDDVDELVDTVRNFRSKARYDFFLTTMDAVFAAAGYRWDTFAGLDTRFQLQPGYMRIFYRAPDHRFWGELGYDFTYDNYHPDPLPNPDDMDEFLDGDEVVHSARGFLGYDNKLNAALTFLTGLEALVNVEDTGDLRLNWDNALRSSIGGNFQLEAKFTIQYDMEPVPGAEKLDTLTTLTIIYTLI
jgi:putative salt-induced outer membrane protein YdiY